MKNTALFVSIAAFTALAAPCQAASFSTMNDFRIDGLSLDTPTVRLEVDLSVFMESGDTSFAVDYRFSSAPLGRMIVASRTLTNNLTSYKTFDVDLGPNYIGAHWPTDTNSFRYLQLDLTINNLVSTDPGLKPSVDLAGVGFDLLNSSGEIDKFDSQYFVDDQQHELQSRFTNPPLLNGESVDWTQGGLPVSKEATFSLLVKLDDTSNFSLHGIDFSLRSRFTSLSAVAPVPLPMSAWFLVSGFAVMFGLGTKRCRQLK